MDSTKEIVIVGAGPTGLTLAAELQRLGVSAHLFEKHATPQQTSRAVAVHARTLEVLEPLGITERLLQEGIQLKEARLHHGNGLPLHVGFTGIDSAYNFILSCPQDRTEAALNDRLRELGGAAMRSAKVTEILSGSDGELVTYVAAGTLVQQMRADWVIGCDGHDSTVRQAAGIEFDGGAYDETFVLADVEMDYPLGQDGMDIFLAPEGLLVVVPLPGKRYRVIATAADGSEPPSLEETQRLLDERGPQQPQATVLNLGWSSSYNIQHRVASALRKGRLLILGDAAHVHSPAGGQGMNTGIQDAVSLADALHQAITTGDETPLKEWETKRLEIARSVVRTTDLMTRAATSDSSVTKALRGALLGTIGHVPFLQHALAERLSEVHNR